ncbi:PLC-like phosphodiesterase [Multifurca ochricompacta]|uniref:PLC-like phosphodiesterase n=1 Tax=Multifurca ochricompacta TaxID=376703 RepID=A0AAD4QK92_9AGAM|nr:PLC-like phosphodiesterase [Multifurca ochricompacta]
MVCNGHPELCDRSYGNVTFAGAHDSFAFSKDPFALARDQEVNVPRQLSLGIRLLQAQSHTGFDGLLRFCHTNCFLFDGGTVEAYLKHVVTFLEENPNEVLTLLFTNPEGLSFLDVWAPVFEASGASQYAYIPPQNPMPQSAWPTLGEMIANGTRLVVFIDFVGKDGQTVDFILPEFGMIWETPYGITNVSFPCSIDRIRGPLDVGDQMYLINHSLNVNAFGTGIILSDPLDAPITNSVISILAHSDQCVPLGNGRNPNFVLLDYVNIGEALEAVDLLNGFPIF